MMLDYSYTMAAFLMGLAGAGHCLGMCGGIMSALSLSSTTTQNTVKKFSMVLCYNTGRLSSYTLMGAVVASGVSLAPSGHWPVARTVAAGILLFMGLYMLGLNQGILRLEKLGQTIWRRIQPLGRFFLPVDRPEKALALGFIWGWLPCGLVYSALIFSSAQKSVLDATLVMFAFGLGTLPSLLLSGMAAVRVKSLLQRTPIRWLMGGLYIVLAGWTLVMAWGHMAHTSIGSVEHHHQHHQ